MMDLACFFVEQWSCPWKWTLSTDNPQSKQTQSAKSCKAAGSLVHTSALSQPLLYTSLSEWILWLCLVICVLVMTV